MTPEAQAKKEALARFNDYVLKLSNDDLLDLKIAFDRLPPPDERGRSFRRAQAYTIAAALLRAFGVGKSREPLAARWEQTKHDAAQLRNTMSMWWPNEMPGQSG